MDDALADPIARRDALVARLTEAALGTMDLCAVYLGERLGYYRALQQDGPATSMELATRTGTHERYAREWLEQQAVTGMLLCDDASAEAGARRYALPAGYDEVLTEPTSLTLMAPMALGVVAGVSALPAVAAAFRSGGGVPYEAYGPDIRDGVAWGNRPQFHHFLGSVWIPAMPEVHARLSAEPPARIAELGCGSGWACIAFARAYPRARIDGFDLDEGSVAQARANAEAAGVADRVTFQVRNAGDPTLAEQYDFACAFECIHDMANPVAALAAMRRLVGAGGTALVVDERAAETFTAPGDELERLLYGFSIIHCLPVGMVDQPSAATGTVMRPATFRGYATAAGFRAVDELPIESDLWRFYRLTA